MEDIRKQKNLYTRKVEFETLSRCWPEKIPIILQKHENSLIAEIKPKFLCPIDFRVIDFVVYMRRKVHLPPSQSLYIMTDSGSILTGELPMKTIYDKHKDSDGFLYLKYSEQPAYGN